MRATCCGRRAGSGSAQVASRAMRVHRWPANIRGAIAEEEGGVVAAPTRLFLPSDRRGVVARFATENAISEEQEMALNAVRADLPAPAPSDRRGRLPQPADACTARPIMTARRRG